MPRIRFAATLLFVLALTACAPAPRNKTAQTAATSEKSAPPMISAINQPKPASRPLHVVMGQPLPPTSVPGPGPALTVPEAAPAMGATPAQPAEEVSVQTAPATALPPAIPAPDTGSPAAPAAGIAPPTGFGGLAWGASAKSHPGLAAYEVDKAANVTTRVWPEGPKDIVGAPIRDAFYEFYQDRFYHVWIDIDGMAAYKTALDGLTRAYGPPTQQIPDKYYNAWTLGDVNIYCAFHPAENDGDVSFFYQPIYEPMMAARKAAAAKSAPRRRTP